MTQKRIFAWLTIVLVFILSGCATESIEPTPNIAGTAAAMAETIVAVQLTKIAEEATSTPTQTPVPTLTPSPTQTFSLPTQFPTQQGDTGTCLLAHMISETIPDDTVMEAGVHFDKTWDIQNTGTCTWTEQFSVVFHHGDLLGAPQQTFFPGTVEPGESFTLSVPMVAPAVPGEHLGFWNLLSPDGQAFGTGSSGLFWVKIIVGDVVAEGVIFDIWGPTSEGGVLSTGEINSNVVAGDTANNYPWQGFATFNLANIPANATVTAVSMLFQGSNINGTPFSDLGCMGVYHQNYGNIDPSDFYSDTPGGALWSFCSSGEITAGASRIGGESAISAIQNSIGGVIQFRYQFNTNTDNDSVDDYATLFPLVRVEYTVP